LIYFFEKMRNFGAILITLLIIFSGCYDKHSEPPTTPPMLQANAHLGELNRLCANGCYNIVSDIVCVGRITSSDRDGNFYRSVFVEDGTSAVEIKLGTYNTSTQYPVGLEVAIYLKGTAIMFEDNILQIGLPPQSYDTAPREFEVQEIIDRHIVRSNSIEEITPLSLDIPSLHTSLCGRFVRISGLQFAPITDNSSNGYYRFIDSEERIIFVYISPYANFSTIALSTTTTTIQGILCHEPVGGGMGHQFVIKPRFADDISDIEHNM